MDFLSNGALRALGALLRSLLVVTGGGVITFLEFKTKNVALQHTKATCLHAKAHKCTVQTDQGPCCKTDVVIMAQVSGTFKVIFSISSVKGVESI